MIKIRHDLLTTPKNRPFLRDPNRYAIKELRGIVLHWTGNRGRGADAQANRNYYQRTDRYSSAHFNVDDKITVQCLPIGEVGFHCGGRRYTEHGKALRKGYRSPNYVTIGVEVCVNSDGDFPTAYQNAVELVAQLLLKTGTYVDIITNHNLITGKDCPQFPDRSGNFKLMDEYDMQQFKRRVEIALFHIQETIEIL